MSTHRSLLCLVDKHIPALIWTEVSVDGIHPSRISVTRRHKGAELSVKDLTYSSTDGHEHVTDDL